MANNNNNINKIDKNLINKDNYYVVFYHNNLDGLVSAVLFFLRGVPALELTENHLIFCPISYDNSINFDSIREVIQKNIINENENAEIKTISLDFNSDIIQKYNIIQNIKKDEMFMVIDHHILVPTKVKIAIHDSRAISCADLIVKTFPIPGEHEDVEQTNLLLNATRLISKNGKDSSIKELSETLFSVPGCLALFEESYNYDNDIDILKVLARYLTNASTTADSLFFKTLITNHQKHFDLSPKLTTDNQNCTLTEKRKDKIRFRFYKHSNTLIGRLYFKYNSLKVGLNINPNIVNILILERDNAKQLVHVFINNRKLKLEQFEFNYNGCLRIIPNDYYVVTFTPQRILTSDLYDIMIEKILKKYN